MANWKKIGKIASRVVGTVAGALLTIPTGGLVNPLTGYTAGATISDAALKENPILKQQTNISPFNQMDAYIPGAKGRAQQTTSYWAEPNRGFDKALGLVDTGISIAGLAAGSANLEKLGIGISKGLGVGRGFDAGKSITKLTKGITSDYLKQPLKSTPTLPSLDQSKYGTGMSPEMRISPKQKLGFDTPGLPDFSEPQWRTTPTPGIPGSQWQPKDLSGLKITSPEKSLSIGSLKGSGNLIDSGKQLEGIQSMLDILAPNQFSDLQKKLTVQQEFSPIRRSRSPSEILMSPKRRSGFNIPSSYEDIIGKRYSK